MAIGPPEGWDAAAYLKANPDVAADPYWGSNPLGHYYSTGMAEGRTWSGAVPNVSTFSDFNAQQYLLNNPDVAADPYYGANPLQHFIETGKAEGRSYNKPSSSSSSSGSSTPSASTSVSVAAPSVTPEVINLGPGATVGSSSVDYTQDARMADMIAALNASRAPRQQRGPTEFDRLIQEQLEQSKAQSFLTPYEAPSQQMVGADITISNPLEFMQSVYQDPSIDLDALYADFMENEYDSSSRADRIAAYGFRNLNSFSENTANIEGGGPLSRGLSGLSGGFEGYLPDSAYEYAGGFTPEEAASGAFNPESLSYSFGQMTGTPGSEGYGDYDVAYETGVSRLPPDLTSTTGSGLTIEASPEYQAYIDKLSNTLLSGFKTTGYEYENPASGAISMQNANFDEFGRPQDYGDLATAYNKYMAANPDATQSDFVNDAGLNFKVADLSSYSEGAPEEYVTAYTSSGGIRDVFEGSDRSPGFVSDLSYKDPDSFSSVYGRTLNRPSQINVDGTDYDTRYTSNAYYSYMPAATLNQIIASGNAYNALANPEYFTQNIDLFKDNPFVSISGTLPEAQPTAPEVTGPRKTYAEYAKELAQNRRAGILGLAPELI